MKSLLPLTTVSLILGSTLCADEPPTRVIPGATLLMVAGGVGTEGDVEVLDMTTDLPLPCFKPTDLPEVRTNIMKQLPYYFNF